MTNGGLIVKIRKTAKGGLNCGVLESYEGLTTISEYLVNYWILKLAAQN